MSISFARVGIVEIGQPTLAGALRSVLEHAGLSVVLWRTGVPSELFGILESGSMAPDYLILCAAADAGGIIFPRAATEFDLNLLKHGRLPFDVIRERVFLPHKVLIAAGPGLGHPDCARAFVDGGVAAFFGAHGDVDEAGVVSFASIWSLQHLVRNKTMEDAAAIAAITDEGAGLFRMYGPSGVIPLAPIS